VKVLAAALTAAGADDAEGLLLQARARALQGAIEEGGVLLRRALERTDDEDTRRRYAADFLLDALDAGHAVRAYAVAPNPETSFPLLAQELFNLALAPEWPEDLLPPPADREKRQEAAGQLRQLLAAHQQKQPRDPLLPYYRGELHRLAKEYDKAEASFARGMAQPLDEDLRSRYRAARVHALFQAGKGLEAHATVGPRRDTFLQLAGLFTLAKDAKGLDALLALHRKVEPTEPELPLWEIEARWLAGEYAEVVRALRKHAAGLFAGPGGRWQYRDRLVRSLARLGRHAEALEQAEAFAAEQGGDALLLAVAHARAGDRAQTVAAMERCAQWFASAHAFYNDPDLGPVMCSDAFRAVRERFPEPIRAPRE
jgi:hypothetical protein